MTAGEFRTDPITGRVAIMVPGRSARPNDHAAPPPSAPADPGCPFCEGNETRTPSEVAVAAPPGRAPNTRGWWVRTIPNRFPTVTSDSPAPSARPGTTLLASGPAFGYHEVVIEDPAHAPTLGFLPREQVHRVLRMFRDRVRYLSGLPNVGSVTLFENTGPESGGSLWHPHAQLVTIPGISPSLQGETEGAERLRARSGSACAFEEIRSVELQDGRRVVFDTGEFTVFEPFASAFPFETRVLPVRHAPSFASVTDAEIEVLADLLPSLLRAFLTALPGASYNYVLRTPVAKTAGFEQYHWHLDLYPRLVRPDGFDLGSGLAVNTVLPEVAAETLRTTLAAKR